MNYSLPRIRVVNKEIKDPSLFLSKPLEEIDFSVGFSVKLHDLFEDGLVFFVHVELEYKKDDTSKVKRIFHTDYLSKINFDESIDLTKSLLIEKEELAHLLGMSVLMIRGSIMTLLQYHPLEQFNLPTLNPLELLEEKLEVKEGCFVLNSVG